MILGGEFKLADDSPEEEEVSDNCKKRQRYVYKCKEAAWKRWVHEYLTALERDRETEREREKERERERKISENQYQRCGHDKRKREASWKVEDWNY